MEALGWDRLDVLLVSGDSYVDHPSFGIVLLARWLIENGFRCGLVCQPRWDREEDVCAMGKPRLFVGIGAGCVDSMLAHYSAFRKKRLQDAYSPGGRMGLRPNRASIVYANVCRRAFPDLPIVLGGIEASTRRLTHYDFWQDALRRPILFDAKADLLVYGMGERAIVEVARRLAAKQELIGIPGTCWISPLDDSGKPIRIPEDYAATSPCVFPSHEACCATKSLLMDLTIALEDQVHQGLWGYEVCGGRALVVAPPAKPLTTEEMDVLYGLPFTKKAHPSYTEPIPAAGMLATSITSHRGCGGGCSFCSLAMHQGRTISSRSKASILAEARALAKMHPQSRRQKGLAISDIGGPTANMWQGVCTKRAHDPLFSCHRVSCCYPTVCPFFHTPQAEHVALLQAVKALPGVVSVRVASGVRFDLALREPEALASYIRDFTGGQIKVAPEHIVPHVLDAMRKPKQALFEQFLAFFYQKSREFGLEQYVVPYLISAFPSCRDTDMEALATWLAKRHWSPKQTQCFIPTPGTIATAMFYAKITPSGEPIVCATTDAERLRQHSLLAPHKDPNPRKTNKTPWKKKPV